MKKIFGLFSNEVFLGMLISLLTAFTAIASYQGAMSDSEQNKYEILGMQALNDGNAEYLSANQDWIQDDNNYDNWFINKDTNPEVADYYYGNFSDLLLNAIDRNGDEQYPIDEQYLDELYTYADGYWADSKSNFNTASQWDERGDQLQLVMLIMALGLTLAAWGSLLSEESGMRRLFAFIGLLALIAGLITYFLFVPIAG